ncbi:hypothetical protein HBB16_09045 [Pseudonocardia sp. MCCB 268]|nr:hypothetical protein [Pseudonocardia cytotoxica]
MAHSVEGRWERDAEALSYHGVGYISSWTMAIDVRQIATSRTRSATSRCSSRCRRVQASHARDLLRLAGAGDLDPAAREARRVRQQLAPPSRWPAWPPKAPRGRCRIETGVTVTGVRADR